MKRVIFSCPLSKAPPSQGMGTASSPQDQHSLYFQGTGSPHPQVPQLSPSPTPWLWGERGGCQELGLGCGRSCPAGRDGDGRESPAAFPAGVGPSRPPSIPLLLPFMWSSTQQPQNTDPKGSFPSVRGLLAMARARIHLQEARSGSTGHSLSPTLLPAGGWGVLGPSERCGSAVRSHRLCTHRCQMTTGAGTGATDTQRDGWGWGSSCVCRERRLPAGRRGPAPRMAPRQSSQRPCATHRCPGGTPSCPSSRAGTQLQAGIGRAEPEGQQGGGCSLVQPLARVIW